MPVQPLSPETPVVREKGELHKQSSINVFAIEDLITKTSEDHVTGQGFGFSSPLEKPVETKSISYRWEGMIHPNDLQKASSPEMIKAYNARESLTELAENFADQYRSHQDSELQAKGESSYALQFQPTQEQIAELMQTNADVQRLVRGLNEEEQVAFTLAFTKSNEAALATK